MLPAAGSLEVDPVGEDSPEGGEALSLWELETSLEVGGTSLSDFASDDIGGLLSFELPNGISEFVLRPVIECETPVGLS